MNQKQYTQYNVIQYQSTYIHDQRNPPGLEAFIEQSVYNETIDDKD